MVEVVPPEGWRGETEPAPEAAESVESAEAAPAVMAGVAAGSTAGPAAGSIVGPPDLPAPESPPIADTSPKALGAESLPPAGTWASPAEMLWRKWILLGAAPLAAVVLIVGAWSLVSSSRRGELPPNPTVQQPVEPGAAVPSGPTAAEPEVPPGLVDRRWLPDRTTLLVSLRPTELVGQAGWSRLTDQIDPLWRPTVGAVLRSLALELGRIRRLTWASTDLAEWPQRSIVVVELQEGYDATPLASVGEPVDLTLAGAACRRLPEADWPNPFAVVDQRTIVTGHQDLVRQLARRSEPDLKSRALRRLLEVGSSDADVALLVDFAAARAADWRLPTALLDTWPAGRHAWHVIWEMPEGLGCWVRCSDRLRSELALVCEGETAAEQVCAAVGELTALAGQSFSAETTLLPEKLRSGKLTAAAAHQYEMLLKEGLAAMQAARRDVAVETVRVRVDWGLGPTALVVAALESRPTIRADWLSAALAADEANHKRLLSGLDGYEKAEGRFPSAVAGGALLPPETRLSWIATMLPYYGHADWHRRLEFGYSWNGPQNRDLTGRPVPEVVNPALGPSKTEAGFPVTHYVGVSGVGADAPRLKADDPRAGVFGYGRTTRPADVVDGAANTIALLGVSGDPGAWAAGGRPTVRALTKRPYVNGPDGFGSGQPDGMLAGMADGSIRYLSKDTDPQVLEQLATIAGREPATVAMLDVKPAPPNDEPEPSEPEQEPAAQPAVDREPSPEVVSDGAGKQPARQPVDVEARLAETIPEIEFRETPLGSAVGLLASMSTVPITFDPDALAQLEVSLNDPVTVRLSEATVREILDAVACSRHLALAVENGHVLITSPSEYREKLRRRRYTVSDLTGTDPTAVGELAATVQKLVAPDSWHAAGGRGTIDAEAGAFSVVQTRAVHHAVLVFCEKLRNARGKPLRSRTAGDPSRFALATRRDRAHRVLQVPVTVNFHEPTPLIEILSYLGELAGADILIDRLALGVAGLSDQAEATLKSDGQPLGVALQNLLDPLGLAYRAIGAETLQVTSRKAAGARLELEFYPVGQWLAAGRAPADLIEQIKSDVAGSTWNDAGGPGVIHFDGPSGHLIVLQSQPVQVAVEERLAGQPKARP